MFERHKPWLLVLGVFAFLVFLAWWYGPLLERGGTPVRFIAEDDPVLQAGLDAAVPGTAFSLGGVSVLVLASWEEREGYRRFICRSCVFTASTGEKEGKTMCRGEFGGAWKHRKSTRERWG